MKSDTARRAVGSYLRSHMDLYLLAAIVGVLSGIIAVAYRICLDFTNKYRNFYYTYARNNLNFKVIGILVLFAIVTSLILGLIVVKCPMVKGSGIPQVKGIIARQMDFNWTKELGTKFFGGVVAIGTGMSMGREGPSVQLGAELGRGIFDIFKRKDYDKKYLVTCGASAGLTAAFGAPFAGVVFAIEEIHKFMSPLLITCVLIASVCAEFVTKFFFGFGTSFDLKDVTTIYQLKYYFLLVIFAFFVTILGKLFSDGIVYFQKLYSKIKIPPVIRPIVVVITSIILGLFCMDVTSGGHGLAEKIIHQPFAYKTLIILFVLKFIFTLMCYGSGAPGGIFLPILVLGALVGKFFGMLVINHFHGLTSGYEVYFVILGMAAFLTAVVKSPLTGTILILEMTGSFAHFFPLVVTCMATFLISELLEMKPIYDILLLNMLPKTKFQERRCKKKVITRIAVGPDTRFDNRRIRDIHWPEGCLVVALERGEEEIIPNGDDKVQSGDIVVILTDEGTANNMTLKLMEMGEKIIIDRQN
ncbi:ClC family H(+)/Cl(-) exchange transporter [Fusobacterium sp. MFO224]|uniref:ClC family H(+)/Cl(-) exchange transporter n=1 Tax=Fusobacterium sp. MFO224 TaxID=3378070 RepID=UPI003852B554